MNNNHISDETLLLFEEQRLYESLHLLRRIGNVYTSYLASLADGMKLDGITAADIDDMNAERVLCEYNYARCCQLYDMNYAAFLETYGKYSERDNLDILLDILINGYPDDKTYQRKMKGK